MTAIEDPSGDSTSRTMWRALEPYHAVTYFSPEAKAAADAAGCKGYWMGYFGCRAAPLGAVAPEIVTATFYNFNRSRVVRAIPDVWQVATPEQLLAARVAGVDSALRRLLTPEVLASDELAEAAALGREAACAAEFAGRALAAANEALEWPVEPHLALWHAQTLLRESRGDAHVAALVTARLDPCECLVVMAASGRVSAATLAQSRAWPEQDWLDASNRLRERGLLDANDALTAEGARLRTWVEERTDEGSDAPWRALGLERTQRLFDLARPIVGAVLDGGGFMAGNPMGLQPLARPSAG